MQTVTSADYDRDVEIMVSREIRYCLSHLVHVMATTDNYIDELAPVLIRDDYEEALIQAGYRIKRDDDGWFYIVAESASGGDTIIGSLGYRDEVIQEACELEGIDPVQDEAYEHWAVTDWLADKLEAKGEMIARDFLGLTIWGRTTTGQAISMDCVIREIYDDIHRKAA